MVAIARRLVLLLLLLVLAPLPQAVALEPEGALGQQLFANHCAGCHIHGGNIIRRNKTLKLDVLQRQGIDGPAAIAAIAAAGVGQMGGYAAVLGDGGPEAVAAWVWQQAELGWPRG